MGMKSREESRLDPMMTRPNDRVLDLRGGSSASRIALFGGIYNNYLALNAVLDDAVRAGAETVFFLGDAGGFGPHPDRSIEILRDRDIVSMQGNYDDSVGNGLDDCQCGYVDPRDNHYAQISYDYTFANTSQHHRDWLRELPTSIRLNLGSHRLLLAHGSPRRVNEFLWETTTSEPFIERLLDEQRADLVCVTHTGIPWQRRLATDPNRGVLNVGAIGRPANDGSLSVWYALVSIDESGDLRSELRSVAYDTERLAAEMRNEGLPDEFVETIETGWWTTCLEILPAKERAAGRF